MKNRTYKYLFPLLNYYHKNMTNNLEKKEILGVYLGHKELDKDNLYIVTKYNPFNFVGGRSYTKKHYDLKYQYPQRRYYVFVIEIPKIFKNTVESFLEGEYSKMFENKKWINKLYKPKDSDDEFMKAEYEYRNFLIKAVFDKDKNFLARFKQKVSEDFDVEPLLVNEDTELDYKPLLYEEILEYEGDKLSYYEGKTSKEKLKRLLETFKHERI